jgi:hypothetical protein
LHFAFIPDCRDQRAFIRLAGKHNRPTFGTPEETFARVEPQPAFALFFTMAIKAPVRDDGTNFRFKEFLLGPLIPIALREQSRRENHQGERQRGRNGGAKV